MISLLTKKHFCCPVLFNQPDYSITYHTSDLETRTAKADESINNFLVTRVEEEVSGLKVAGNKLVYDIEKLIKDALPSGIPSIHQIAQHVGMSNRTLTRRLSEADVTYRDLIKKTQEEVAIHLLKKSMKLSGTKCQEQGYSIFQFYTRNQ